MSSKQYRVNAGRRGRWPRSRSGLSPTCSACEDQADDSPDYLIRTGRHAITDGEAARPGPHRQQAERDHQQDDAERGEEDEHRRSKIMRPAPTSPALSASRVPVAMQAKADGQERRKRCTRWARQ